MNGNEDSVVRPLEPAPEKPSATTATRRPDIDAKHERIAVLLKEVGCQALLVFEPENFAWLTSGGTIRGNLDPGSWPALLYTADERWVIASNTESQRLFDEELDSLGFQLKEWPWHWGRQELLADLCRGRSVACDRPWPDCRPLGDSLRRLRRTLSLYDQACYRALGQILAHALEATCRSLQPRETEREVAGQLSHRLIHRGAVPVSISVAADGRLRRYRQCGFTSLPILQNCVLLATARKYGLCATASRTVNLGPPDATFRQEMDAVCSITAAYIAGTWPDSGPREILASGRRVYKGTGFEHDWLLAPQGFVSGWAPVELAMTARTTELLQTGWAVTWSASAGSACSCDTFVVAGDGCKLITPADGWPQKRIRMGGLIIIRPDVLQR
jgi:Xaa-Pro aminopeptidase